MPKTGAELREMHPHRVPIMIHWAGKPVKLMVQEKFTLKDLQRHLAKGGKVPTELISSMMVKDKVLERKEVTMSSLDRKYKDHDGIVRIWLRSKKCEADQELAAQERLRRYYVPDNGSTLDWGQWTIAREDKYHERLTMTIIEVGPLLCQPKYWYVLSSWSMDLFLRELRKSFHVGLPKSRDQPPLPVTLWASDTLADLDEMNSVEQIFTKHRPATGERELEVEVSFCKGCKRLHNQLRQQKQEHEEKTSRTVAEVEDLKAQLAKRTQELKQAKEECEKQTEMCQEKERDLDFLDQIINELKQRLGIAEKMGNDKIEEAAACREIAAGWSKDNADVVASLKLQLAQALRRANKAEAALREPQKVDSDAVSERSECTLMTKSAKGRQGQAGSASKAAVQKEADKACHKPELYEEATLRLGKAIPENEEVDVQGAQAKDRVNKGVPCHDSGSGEDDGFEGSRVCHTSDESDEGREAKSGEEEEEVSHTSGDGEEPKSAEDEEEHEQQQQKVEDMVTSEEDEEENHSGSTDEEDQCGVDKLLAKSSESNRALMEQKDAKEEPEKDEESAQWLEWELIDDIDE